MKRRKPAWRILSALIMAALLLNAPAYLPAKSSALAASNTEIVVENADSIQKFSFEKPNEVLLSLAREVMPRIVIEHADSTFHAGLASPSQDLIDAAGVVAPRIIIQYANSTFHAGLASPPQDLIDAAGVVAPRIIIQYANSTFHAGLASPPQDLIDAAGVVAPRIIIQYTDSTFHHNLVQFPRPQFAISAIDQAKEAITIGTAAGLDMTGAETLLLQAEEALAARDYREAINIARQAETTAVGVKEAAALQQIDQAKDAITIGRAAGLDMTGAETLLLQAEEALAEGDFGGAISIARGAKIKAEEITREMRLARSSIKEAKQVISQESAKGFDVVEAEHMILQAEEAFADRDYERAIELAATAKSLALDIDQDGVLNYRDFAPTVHNNLIYIVGVLVFLIALFIGIFFYRRRKKAEKEEIEGKRE